MVFLAGCIRLLQAHFKLVVSQFAVAAIRQPTDSPSWRWEWRRGAARRYRV